MSIVLEAKEYILHEVILPALNSTRVSDKAKEQVKRANLWIQHCHKVGDIYDYIIRFKGMQDGRYSKVYSELKNNNLIPIEDIIEPFREKYNQYLNQKFTINELLVDDIYTSWDLAILAKSYNVQRGISLIEESGELKAILTKVTIGEGRYPNEWIEEGVLLKHYMLTFKEKTDVDYKSNQAIINSGNIPILVFIKKDQDCRYVGNFQYLNYVDESDGTKWFRLKKINSVNNENFNSHIVKLEDAVKRSLELDEAERLRLMKSYKSSLERKVATIEIFDRNPHVVAFVLKRASGICELCSNKAPFIRASDGTPYLEVHHKIPLAKGGADEIENVIAVCPNCHRKAHFG